MKKVIKLLVLFISVAVLAICAAACGGNDNAVHDKNTELDFYAVYASAVDLGFKGTLEELIAAFKGDSAYQIAVTNGYKGSEADWLASLVGARGDDGEDGKDGITPHIGANGNWFVGATDTGIKAAGKDGEKGDDGEDGKDGITPHIGANGNWFVGATDTGIKAAGKDGEKGDDGKDGENGASAYEIFVKYNPDYPGNEERWINDLAAGKLVRFTVTFKAAGSEDIVKTVFYGYDLTDIPEVPEQPNSTGVWNRTDFTNITGNITVTAIYKARGIYELINDGTEYMLTSANLDNSVTVAEIPREYEGKPVTAIGSRAFAGYLNLTRAVIPDTVTRIEPEAFYGCTSITEMTVPFLGESASSANSTLSYMFGGSVPSSIRAVIVTGGNSIGDGAFLGCGNLTSLSIPDSVTSIGDRAFLGCGSLTSLIIPDSVTSIGDGAFSNCGSLTSIKIPNGVAAVGDYLFGDCSSLNSVTIGSSVTSIGDGAFSNCGSLTTLTVPNGVISIGEYAFRDCVNLNSLSIPDSVASIGERAFIGCSALQYEEYNNLKYINNVLFAVTDTAITNATLKPTTTVIYSNAFFNCSALTSITIPSKVVFIGRSAFRGCDSLESITLPFVGNDIVGNENTHFGYIFGAAHYIDNPQNVPSSLKTVVITGGNSIAEFAFYGCYDLLSIMIPDSVTSIADSAFRSCRSLTSIIIPDSVTTIGVFAFEFCETLTSIKIPNSVTTIGDFAFFNCLSLTSITIGSSVTMIGKDTFRNCRSLTSIIIPDSVTSIGDGAFDLCNSLTKVYYTGTAEQWDGISIAGNNNDSLTDATIYYYSETEPTESGNYWHYDEGGNVVIYNAIT